MNNPKKLLGKTFTRTGQIGVQIEALCGSGQNSRKGSDFKFWEIKSRRIGTRSAVSLGSLNKDASQTELENYVWSKIQNTIEILYTDNGDKTFTIEQVSYMYGMPRSQFKGFFTEQRARVNVIRAHIGPFRKMFGEKIITYKA